MRRVSHPSLMDNWLLFLLAVAVLFWILDSGLRALVFRESSFVEQALSPDPRDLLGRVLVVCLVTLLGIYAIAALGKAKQAVRAAELARAEADQVFNSMAHAVGVIDLDRKVRRVNDAFSALTGAGKEEASGRRCFQVLRAPMCDTAGCLLRRLLAGEERVEHEWETQPSEGGVTTRYHVVATALRDHRRELVGMVQHLTKLAEASRSERPAWDLSAVAADVVQAIPAGLLLYEYQPPDRLLLLDGNPQAEHLCGMAVDEWRGQELNAMWPRARDAGLSEALGRPGATGGPVEVGGLLCATQPEGRSLQVRAFRLPRGRVGLLIDRPGEEDLAEQRRMTSIRELQDLLEDVRHRHRDDLQLISNLLDLQCETIRDERSLRALKECRSRIRAITLVYQRLLESEGWSRVDFADYLGRQLARLFQTYDGSLGAITSRICVEQARLEIDMAIPCGLIVNELVSNSLRHAFPEGREGEILVEVSRGPKGEHRLVIGDNGVGFPDDLDFRQTETLGLQLVTLLVKQLDGTIELDRSHGTTFRITLFGPRSPHPQR